MSVMDHFTKFHILFPMKLKQAKELVHGLMECVFGVFGLPYILHSDNGIEFVNNLIVDTIKAWPGEFKLFNGKARSRWVQGCVEKRNHCFEMITTEKRNEKSSNDWVSWLPEIQCK